MAKIHQFSRQDVDLINRELVYDGFFKVYKYQLTHKMFSGEVTPPITREVLDRGHAVAMLPYDPVSDEFVLIEQFRVGAMATSDKPWLLEIVAGMIDKGESVEDVCRRESKEEAGLEVRQLVKLADYLPSPGGTSERLHIFLGIVDASDAQGVHGLDSEHEDIMVHKVSSRQAWKLLNDNEFDNSATIVALQWFFLHKTELLEKLAKNEV